MKIATKNKIPKLRFPEFSGGWEERVLGEIGETYNGLVGKAGDDFGLGESFITYKQIFDSSEIDTQKFSLVKVSKNEKQNKAQFGDIFFTTSSETPHEVGFASVLLDKNISPYLNSFSFGLRLNSLKEVDPYFAKFLFRNSIYRKEVIKLAQGSTRYNISKIGFTKIRLAIPSISEQKKIAEFLGTTDEWIENLRLQKKSFESYKKGMMQKIFSQEIRFKDKSGKNFPKWKEKKLGDMNVSISDGNYGEMYPKANEMIKSGVPFIRANNIKNLKIVWDDMKFISSKLHESLQSGHLKENDILVTTRGDIGMLAYVDKEFNNANINAQICLLRCGKNIFSRFLLNYLSSRIGKKQFTELQTGSALKQLPKGNLAKIKIKLPFFTEQQEIAEFLTSIDNLIESKQQQIIQADQWKKGLMQQMFI